MKKVVICDDEITFAKQIRGMIENNKDKFDEALDIKSYESSKSMKFDSNINDIDILFIDIELGKENGIDIVKEIQKINNNFSVIYITSHNEYVYRSFETKVCGFLRKPFEEDEVIRAFTKAFNEQKKDKIIELCNGKSFQRIFLNELMYITSNKRKVLFHCKDRCNSNDYDIGVYGKLDECEKRIKDKGAFVRVRKSIIINFDYVELYEGNIIKLRNGEEFIISRNKMEEVRNKYVSLIID